MWATFRTLFLELFKLSSLHFSATSTRRTSYVKSSDSAKKETEKRNNAFPRTRYTIQIFSVYVFIHTSPYKVADLITRLSEKRIHMHLLDPADKRRRIPKSYLHADVHVITELEYGSVWKAGDALKSAW